MRFLNFGLLIGLLLTIGLPLRAADEVKLEFVNLGLKNNYRIIFEQWDSENHFASGALEISDNAEEKLHTRIPFVADIKVDAKDKKTEVLSVRCTALDSFFAPANKKEPYPPLTWKLSDRQGKQPKLKAAFWTFGKSTWVLENYEFEKPQK